MGDSPGLLFVASVTITCFVAALSVKLRADSSAHSCLGEQKGHCRRKSRSVYPCKAAVCCICFFFQLREVHGHRLGVKVEKRSQGLGL